MVIDIFNKDFTEDEFLGSVLKLFRFQSKNNPVYAEYLSHRKIQPGKVDSLEKIPFLPIEFFRTRKVVSFAGKPEMEFVSSGSTDSQLSTHYIADLSLYKKSFTETWHLFYGDPSEYCFLALLPGYLERKNSSLVYMVGELIGKSNCDESGFFLYDHDELSRKIEILGEKGQKTVLIGVSYALLDFAAKYNKPLPPNIFVMETGGMKGKRKELPKKELHAILKRAFGKECIHSEYGMTELLSQAYSSHNGFFKTPPWLHVFIRDIYDPFAFVESGESGGINIIDLANQYSCAFIETQDLGRKTSNGFEVLGRIDHSLIRGCNLMVS